MHPNRTLSRGTSPPLMDALKVYGSSSSESDENEEDDDAPPFKKPAPSHTIRLPPPCMETLNSIPNAPIITIGHERRSRSFPHVEGNFALHVYIPVIISPNVKGVMETLLANAFALCPQLCGVDIVQPVPSLDNAKRIIVAKEYHISLSHTVPVRIHQISSLVSMMRQRFRGQKRSSGLQ